MAFLSMAARLSESGNSRRMPLVTAAVCALAVLGWWTATVHSNYRGNWTALYCTGARQVVPPALGFEGIYQFPDSAGFDGQFYHYMAHDPFLRNGLSRYVDAPRLRYRRILLPGMAYLLAGGRQEAVDTAYRAITLLFLLAGVYWVGVFAVRRGVTAFWGAGFLLAGAAIVSIDRLTVDLALTALAAGFFLYSQQGPPWKLYAVLAMACLARETGWLLLGAYCLHLLLERQWRRSLLFATAGLPCAAWYVYVYSRTESWSIPLSFVPFRSFFDLVWHPIPYNCLVRLAPVVRTLDLLANLGVWLGFGLAIWLVIRRAPTPARLACGLFAGLGIMIMGTPDWHHVYDSGRVFSPLVIMLALDGWDEDFRWLAAPMLLMLPRLLVQLGPQAAGIPRFFRGV